MLIYCGEQSGKRIKLTTDRDCLAPDLVYFGQREFVNYDAVLRKAETLWKSGYQVCVDTERGLVEYEH